ncbi:membrane fusion protein, multidrug efflux system [Lutimaribacter pacificus]|uniref:Membrane fusion protein, multidrug efflux system n=1 Tax=Lutimaribacter pacificus TaxID=391948 RepID=A0A1H0M8E7_9RHOB|nr:efflux RND transporter periplasmic adaptor subunit [Lutimaribacter pacificus]SDO76605.1 membrane fusion protein, multidrug efflux system [Lutimaribacter pacificus]SHK78920.1 membrane fusion protein, multidrug efflux system [Lutimaribacter pacificus]
MPTFRLIAPILAAALAFTAPASPATAQQAPGGEAPPMPVTVVTVEASDVLLTSTLPGRVAASGLAEVRPQVSGIVTERLFEEGRPVEAGDPLYRIDAASYEAAKAAAEAGLAQAEAQLRAAQREEMRQQELLDRNVTSRQVFDDAVAARDVAAAAVKVAEAQVLAATIDLERTTIRAPISGTVGLSQTTQGALVTAGQSTALTVIRKLDPVNVDVTQSAAEILQWRRTGQQVAEEEGVTVALRLADGGQYEHEGFLAAAEPHVNEQTGVIVLRLEFPNPERFLLPGMYVQVVMPQGVVQNAILAPQEGVTRDRRGRPVAMVVNEENQVEMRELTVQRDQGNQWVVTEGLTPGDRIIVAGLQKVAPGMVVKPEERGAAEAAPTGN